MSPVGVAWALVATALVFLSACIAVGLWVSDSSRGYRRRYWHRPLVGILGIISGALFIAAAWTAALA